MEVYYYDSKNMKGSDLLSKRERLQSLYFHKALKWVIMSIFIKMVWK